jgi:ectoine hydroxylase-related dioxygenase (phytanoyl-CoA dioxygenase family)
MMDTALDELGVAPQLLTDEQARALDEGGYVVFEGLIDADWLAALRERFEYLIELEGRQGATEGGGREQGTRRLYDLVNKGEVFDGVYTHPLLLACVRHVLGRDFKLSSLNARDAEPGQGLQGLHADWWPPRQDGEPYQVVNSIWLLDDFTPQNGATRIVPGSHRLGGTMWEHFDFAQHANGQDADDLRTAAAQLGAAIAAERDSDAEAGVKAGRALRAVDERLLEKMTHAAEQPYPGERLLVGPAGSVVVFNSHLWHAGTVNQTATTRRAMHCYFTARENPQQLDQREYIRKVTYERLSPAARYIVDV